MNKNNKLAVAPVLQFDALFASSRWQSALFKLECFPGRLQRLRKAMMIIAEASCDDAAGLSIFEMDLDGLFAALGLVNDETQTWWNMDDPLSL